MVDDFALLKEVTELLLARRSVFGVPLALGKQDPDITMAMMVIMPISSFWMTRIDGRVDVLGFWPTGNDGWCRTKLTFAEARRMTVLRTSLLIDVATDQSCNKSCLLQTILVEKMRMVAMLEIETRKKYAGRVDSVAWGEGKIYKE